MKKKGRPRGVVDIQRPPTWARSHIGGLHDLHYSGKGKRGRECPVTEDPPLPERWFGERVGECDVAGPIICSADDLLTSALLHSACTSCVRSADNHSILTVYKVSSSARAGVPACRLPSPDGGGGAIEKFQTIIYVCLPCSAGP